MAIRKGRVEVVVQDVEGKVRLDAYLASQTQQIGRSTLSEASTEIYLNGKMAKKSKNVKKGDVITVIYSQEFFEGLKAQNIALSVIHEDDDLLVINKAQGMVVHPANGNYEDTLVNALLYRYGEGFASEIGDAWDKEGDKDEDFASTLLSPAIRPGIVHRLDKDTSGVMVVARNRISHRILSAQFKEHTTSKIYIALAKGYFPKKQGTIDAHLCRDKKDRKKFTVCSAEEGRNALTDYRVLKQYEGFALVRITLHTGRTHQIRVHFASLGHPLVGDVLYGKSDGTTLMLHALSLELHSPSTGLCMKFHAPLPERFKTFIKGK